LKYIEANKDPEYEEYLYGEFTKISNEIIEKKESKNEKQ